MLSSRSYGVQASASGHTPLNSKFDYFLVIIDYGAGLCVKARFVGGPCTLPEIARSVFPLESPLRRQLVHMHGNNI